MQRLSWFRHPERLSGLRTCCLILVSSVLILPDAWAQSGGWVKKTTLPTLRGALSACVIGQKIYTIGGTTVYPWTDLANNEVYDVSLNSWSVKLPIPTSRGWLSSAVVNDTIYAMGGGYPTATRKVEAYNPVTNTWTAKADMLSPRLAAQAGVVNGIIYNIGGNQSERNCEAYNPVTNTWSSKKEKPESGGDLAVTVYNGLVYTFGGGYTGTAQKNVYAYDPQTDNWSKKTDMPTARYGFQTYLVGGKIYAIGGTQTGALKTVEEYNPVSDTWQTLDPMPEALAWFAGAVLNDKIYVISGTPDGGYTGTGDIWEYDPNPTISVTPQAVDFGNVLVGQSSDTIDVEIKNPGLHPLIVNSATLDGTAFSLSNLPSLPVTLAPSDSIVFGVFFRPILHGNSDARVVVETNDTLHPTVDIALEGCGLVCGPELQQFIGHINAASYPDRPAMVDSFLAEHPIMPFIEEDSIAQFLYRGPASSVSVSGDANRWLINGSPMTRLSSTDLWFCSDVFEPDARLEYKFVLNGSTWILDPRNPATCSGGYGPNSELAMPLYTPAPELNYYPGIPHGVVYDTTVSSTALGYGRSIRVYTPPGYSSTGMDSFQVAVFHDGLDWVNLARANNALDYLIYHNRIRPIIAVFVPPVSRDPEYIGALQDQFAAFIATELMPYVDARFRTQRRPLSRASIGISNGGNIALRIMHTYPKEYGNAASFSGYILGTTSSAFDCVPAQPCKLYVDAGTYDLAGFLDISRNFRDVLQTRGFDYRYKEWHEGHSWGSWGAHLDNALEFFFPGSAVKVQEEQEKPNAFVLQQNYPNPFNPTTKIQFTIANRQLTIVKVFDLLGREVAALVNEVKQPGTYTVEYDGSNLASGVYFYRLQAEGFVSTKRMLILK